MARTPKIPKYKEFDNFESTFIFTENSKKTKYFKTHNPLVLELGCGKAEPTLAFAKKYPNKNFMGIDSKADRLWRPAKTALEENITNAIFLKMHLRFIDKAFTKKSVDEIWLTFSDPHPKKRSHKHRLTHPVFLEKYKKILKPGGELHFKTDDLNFFHWSLEKFIDDKGLKLEKLSFDLHSENNIDDDAKIVTFYENKFMNEGKKINYCQLKL